MKKITRQSIILGEGVLEDLDKFLEKRNRKKLIELIEKLCSHHFNEGREQTVLSLGCKADDILAEADDCPMDYTDRNICFENILREFIDKE